MRTKVFFYLDEAQKKHTFIEEEGGIHPKWNQMAKKSRQIIREEIEGKVLSKI